ncbi:MAG: calcium-translocating P-type ATPase, PMCA-type [Clostridia bacterium]|nr:calcium-translocating P-type ATPase, PMCA-type [Clostridia bacterium]
MESIKGLSRDEVKISRQKYGNNALSQKEPPGFWTKYMEKFNDPIIVILLIALGINVFFTFFGKVDWFECFGIFLSVLISTLVGTVSEYKNEETFQKIQVEASKIRCKVYRDGILQEISGDELVLGDYVLLEAGDLVPADGEIYRGKISVDQSALNGESKEVKKYAINAVSTYSLKSTELDFWDFESLFRGTVVCFGQCIMRVTQVGDKTVYGRLNRETQTQDRKSPLQVKLSNLAKKISYFGYGGSVIVTILCMVERISDKLGGDLSLLGTYFADTMSLISDLISSVIVGITVIVVAVPEGLPLMIAIVCSLNMKKMMRNNVLVRKLIGIETAGSINILFSDKTGTITCGKLKAISFIGGGGNEAQSFRDLSDPLKELLYISVIGNSSSKYSGDKILGGNATEKALMDFVKPFKGKNMSLTVLRENLFSSDLKFSQAQVCGDFSGVLIKGAPEKILKNCTSYYNNQGKVIQPINIHQLNQAIEGMANRAIRVLAIATSNTFNDGQIPQNMTLLGLVGIRDDLRPDVRTSVAEMKRAGIQTVMITGDKKETAAAIAKEAGILESSSDIILTSDELRDMSDDALAKIIKDLRVVARALPSDKSRLVRIAQSEGMVAGMTGDGVNDLSALKLSDVGFAMGSGTDIAKESGDIVILDDNFSSIKKAVLYGRTIYKSIKKFITFQMTINIAAVSVSILGPIVGIDKPLGITQMLWINLVMDTLAAIAFGGEAALGRYMLEKPKRRDENIIDKKMWSAIAVGGLFISAVSLFMFISQDMYYAFRASANDAVFYTGYFSYFVFSCIFNAFNARTEEIDLTEHISLNKPFIFIILLICIVQVLMTYFGGAVLGTSGLDPKEWSLVISMALLIIPVDIFRKLIIRNK